MLKVNGLSFSYGVKDVFNDASFTVGKNQKVGLVGPNGAGKSTLFRILTGQEQETSGRIYIQGALGYVPQEVKRDPILEKSESIKNYIDPENSHQEFELNKILSGLELDLSLEDIPQELSGGQKTKLALAKALLAEPDILLLDEPTNFMDKAGKKFVMNFLSEYLKTLIIVSHDLELLDKHIDKILSINTQTHNIDEFAGTYKEAMKLKTEAEELLQRQYKIKTTHIKQLEESIRKGKFKSKKGARTKTVLKRRVEREKQSLPDLPAEIREFKLNLPEPSRVAEVPIRIEGISKIYGDNTVLNDLSFYIQRGEKFLLIGVNGSGKSTVIKIIMNLVNPESGEVLIGTNVNIGYYSQEFENFEMDRTIIDWTTEKGKVTENRARAFLAGFMFDQTRIRQRIGSLSGGEKTRLSIALLILNNHNVLVLDEPTTYLDPMSQRIVLEALKQYKGTLLLVSHVEDFVKELSPDRALLMPEGKVVLWDEKYLDRIGEV